MFGLSRRERALKKATGALAEFYQVPHPGPRASLADLPMLAVDVETTGLSPRDDRLLSIGWVPIDGGYHYVGRCGACGASATGRNIGGGVGHHPRSHR